jgi:hypothetical protein
LHLARLALAPGQSRASLQLSPARIDAIARAGEAAGAELLARAAS